MKTFHMIALALAMLSSMPSANSLDVSPLGKVIELLSDLQKKIIKEGEESQRLYDEMTAWCDDQSKELGFSIKTGKGEVEQLKASIEDETAKSKALSSKIADLTASIAADEKQLKAAQEVRAQEEADFAGEEKELQEVSETLERAITVLQREQQKGGASMMQIKNARSLAQLFDTMVQGSMISTADASRLTALAQVSQSTEDSDDDADLGAPDAAAYQEKSGSIIKTLEGLLDKTQSQLADARKADVRARGEFEMLQQSLQDQAKFSRSELADVRQGLASSAEKRSSAEGELRATSSELTEDTKALADLHKSCRSRSTKHEREMKSRGEELSAISKAKAVISEAAGTPGISLLQEASASSAATMEAVRFVRNLAKKEDSSMLSQLAVRMFSEMTAAGQGEDVFGKVTDMIKGMIAKLEDEAASDASQKAFCDKELSENAEKREQRSAKSEQLTTKIDQMTSRSAQLKTEVSALQDSLANLAKSQVEMDKLRGKEKSNFDATRPELEKGLAAIQSGIAVLTDYYASGDKAHDEGEGAANSVVALLQVVESDLVKSLADLTMDEELAQGVYERATKENELERATKEKDVEYKQKQSKALEKAAVEQTNDRSGVQEELDSVDEYLRTIQAQCTAKAESYKARQERRENELSGLKEALSILANEAAAASFAQLNSRRLRVPRPHVAA